MSIEYGVSGDEPRRARGPLGPIRPGEEHEIVAGVEQYLRKLSERGEGFRVTDPLTYHLQDAPPALLRRIVLQPPQPGNDRSSWIPWHELGDHFPRVSAAAACRRRLMQENRIDPATGIGTLTAAAVRQLVEEHRLALRALRGSSVDFDLHDVFVCTEAELLELQQECSQPEQEELSADGGGPLAARQAALRQVATEVGGLLEVIGQAVEETAHGQ